MSNEKDTINRPPVRLRNQKRRTRNFSCVTYLTEGQLREVLRRHDNNMKAYAFILHDKDEDKEPHRHVVISLVNATTATAVRSWFSGYSDVKGELINTFVEPCADITAQYKYLTHHDVLGKPLDAKYEYNESDIVSLNAEVFKNPVEEDKDSVTLAVMDLLEGECLRDVANRYGRDFIIHYQSIRYLMNDIYLEEKGKDWKK